MSGRAIAVIGYACRLPGGRRVEDLWNVVVSGRDAVTRAVSNVGATTGGRVHAYGVLEDFGAFDAGHFGYSPREAAEIDPQQRLLLECAVEALESAGVRVAGLPHDIGVYAATGLSGYLLGTRPAVAGSTGDLATLMGGDGHYAATRIAYKLGLTGPALSVGSACSSSLLAIHVAAQAIEAGECDLAVAGGMDVEFPQPTSYLHQEGGIMSRDGVCRPFDARANGTVFGSGGGLVVLCDFDVAHECGWPIRAVLAGSAANNDGSEKASFTAPRSSRQADVILQALAAADVDPGEISYLECHGTGTQLGDRSELHALAQVFSSTAMPPLGSAKANFGHLRVGAGVIGFVKACEVVARGVVPPLANLREPMDIARDLGVRLPRETQDLAEPPAARVVGVSSFGFGGTNVHALVRGYEPTPRPSAIHPGPYVMKVSAADPDSCLATAGLVADQLRADDTLCPADVAHTLDRGRDDHAYRISVVGSDRHTLIWGLQGDQDHLVEGWERPGSRVLLLLPGQGSDLLAPTRALYGWEPAFTAALDEMWQLVREVEPSAETIAAVLADGADLSPAVAHALHVAIELALHEQLRVRGLVVDRVAGYSLGEYAAAVVGGALAAADALRLVVERARVLAEAPPGGMLVVRMTRQEIAENLPGLVPAVTLAADRHILSVAVDDIPGVRDRLTAAGHLHRVLDQRVPYHSPLLAPAAERFAPLADAVTVRPSERLVTTVPGHPRMGAGYWSAHLAEPLDLTPVAQEAAALAAAGGCTVVDLSPDGFLGRCVRAAAQGAAHIVRLLPAGAEVRTAYLKAVAALWVGGLPVDTAPPGAGPVRMVRLPAREFTRRTHLKDAAAVPAEAEGAGRHMVRREKSIDRWVYYPSWHHKRRSARTETVTGQRWLLFTDGDRPGAELVERLTDLGVECLCVLPEDAAAPAGAAGAITVRPGDEDAVKRMIRGLGVDRRPVDRVVHLWGRGAVIDSGTLQGRLATLGDEYENGFYTLLHTVQELGLLQGSHHVHLDIVASGMSPVSAADIVPERALLAGPGLVIPQDFPAMSARTVDITDVPDQAFVTEVLPELLSVATDPTVALGRGMRWVRSYERDELPGVPDGELPLRLREDGVYLITGGLGGIGMTLAEYLVTTCRARLVLTGMEAVPDAALWEENTDQPVDDPALAERVTRIRKLVRLGGEVMVARCDAADPRETAALFAAIDARFGRLDGVVHAAGVFETQRAFRGLDDTGREDCVRRLRPKVEGTLVLAEFLRGRRLDFVLMQSSLSSHLGGLGFYAYTAGNAFMDAFAERHRDADIPWMTVNWDGWIFRERDDDTRHQSVVSPSFASPDFGVVAEIAIRPSEGQEVYSRLMNMREPHQVLISTADFERRIDQWVRRRVEHEPAPDPAGASSLRTGASDQPDDIEQGIAEIWQNVLGVTDLKPTSDFFALGGDSLLGVTVTHQLSLRFGVALSVIAMFDNPTIAESAAEIRRLQSRTTPEGTP
ncbi:SDR family NAD(P)-dependent oxidoreductase [Streptomyces sp. 5-6(2022)]|uniref:SDR family NAD(P)-dependent oxidoreductase n=1 Tax=Streptomyces sp. 5-6(2022) TaxID=2936510 RepID=UPI0023B95473|nr:SDR family NAD(P)-dependent oxidoreductase [Streptomyces sp. 5-6(2022)]